MILSERLDYYEGRIMNWDITVGHFKQTYGRYLQRVGGQFENRKLVMEGERAEYAGRLQMRYGSLKHRALWNLAPARVHTEESNPPESERVRNS